MDSSLGMNSIRQAAKVLAFALSTLVCSPILGWFWIVGSLTGKDRTLEGVSQLLALLPGQTGATIRSAFYSRVLAECPPDVFVGFGSLLTKVDTRLGSHVYIGPYCQLGLVTIGSDTLLGPLVQIPSGPLRHAIDRLDIPIRSQEGLTKRVTIGRDCWLGAGSIVMADVGDQTVVGAGSVVTKPIEPRQLAAGVPCKPIRSRHTAV
jgi:acetyltransferase-like isoleucine patch superfamily enzyme